MIEPVDTWVPDPLRVKNGFYLILKSLLVSTGSSYQNYLIGQTNLVEILNKFQKEPYETPEGEYIFETPKNSRPALLVRT